MADAQEMAENATLLKRFKLVQLIGVGNYAHVYKSLTSSGKEIAIKAINLTKSSENYVKKFLPRELGILKKVNHTNICRTLEILQVADRIFIIMQFCERGTIADLLSRIGPFSEPVSRYLFAQTLEAIIYLHSNEIAHRDVKIENILLTGDYIAKLTDFSYSVNLSEQTVNHQASPQPNLMRVPSDKRLSPSRYGMQNLKKPTKKSNRQSTSKLNNTFCGTLPYLAPEVIRLVSYDARKTDIWSLGICLYVMLNDRLPFPFHDIKLMIKKQLSRDYKFKNVCSEQVSNLVALMLEPDAGKRPTCQDVAKHSWLQGPREKPVIN